MTEGGRVEERVMSVYERLGEPLILTGGASSRTVRAIVGIMSTSFRNARFTSAEYGTWELPALVVRLAGQDPSAPGDTFVRDGRTFTVRSVEYSRFAGVVVATVLCCA